MTAQITPWDDTANFSVQYQVSDTWASEMPQEASEYPVRVALTKSSNITPKTDLYTYGTLTIGSGSTVSVGNITVSVGTTVTEDGKAQITVNDEQLSNILTNADGDVSMDLSGVKDTDQLVLPGNLITGLSKTETTGSLIVSTEDASVVLSAPVLDTVANAVTGDGDKISVKLVAVEEKNLSEEQQAALLSWRSPWSSSIRTFGRHHHPATPAGRQCGSEGALRRCGPCRQVCGGVLPVR